MQRGRSCIWQTVIAVAIAFEKGTSGNRAGRAPGTLNKATTAAREVIDAALSGTDAVKLAAQLNTLTGKDFVGAYIKLAEFISPKLQRTALALMKQTAGLR